MPVNRSPIRACRAARTPERRRCCGSGARWAGPPVWSVWVHSPKVGRTGREPKTRPHAVRTCVGCRLRATKSEFLRVVLARDTATAWLVPDVSGHAPGRGAHVHPTPECVGLAARRHAFPRALRIQGPIDIERLRRHVEAQTENGTTENSNTGEQRQGLARGPARRKESGSSGS
jgi:uncharacterized protein